MAACDRDILGKRFSGGRLQIEVNRRFYEGSLVGEDEAMSALGRATIANIVGNSIVEKAVERSLVSPECVIDIGGVKHAQIVCVGRE